MKDSEPHKHYILSDTQANLCLLFTNILLAIFQL